MTLVNKIEVDDIRMIHFGKAYMTIGLGCAFKFERGLISKKLDQNKISLENLGSNIMMYGPLDSGIRKILEDFLSSKAEINNLLENIKPGESIFRKYTLNLQEWGMEPFYLPIESVSISNIQCERKSKPITADIEFGASFKAKSMPIFDPINEEFLNIEFVKSNQIKNTIDFMIRSESVMREISSVFNTGHTIHSQFKYCQAIPIAS
jgi:hypothetical protein